MPYLAILLAILVREEEIKTFRQTDHGLFYQVEGILIMLMPMT